MTRGPLVTALIDLIPEGRFWSQEEQTKWLKAAKEIFVMAYGGVQPQPIPPAPAPPKRAPAGTYTPTPEQEAAVLAILPEMINLSPDGVTIRMLMDRFKMQYGLARALLLRLGERPEYTTFRKSGTNTLGLFPANATPPEDLSENQKAVLGALASWKVGYDGWIAASAREVAKAAGVSLGSVLTVIDSLERKGRIEVQRNGGDGVNRYKVLAS